MTDSSKTAEYQELVQQLEEPWSRRTARKKLVAAGAVEPLLQCLGSKNESVVWAAIQSLGELKAKEAVEPLIDLLERGTLTLDVAQTLTMITGEYLGADAGKWRQWMGGPTPNQQEAGKQATGGPAAVASAKMSLVECVRKTGDYLGVKPTGSGKSYQFKLSVNGNRTQKVAVYFGREDDDGDELVVIYSVCGPAKPKYYESVLRKNLTIPTGAFGLRDINGQPNFVMVDTMLAVSVTPSALAKHIENIATRADKVEKGLTGEDRR